jgi:hypothetical protein
MIRGRGRNQCPQRDSRFHPTADIQAGGGHDKREQLAANPVIQR